MSARKVVVFVLGALLVATAMASLGACSSPESTDASAADAARETPLANAADAEQSSDTDVLAEMGIDLSGVAPVPPQSGSATGETTTAQLDAATLQSLSAPAEGMLIGEVLGSGTAVGSIEVRVDTCMVLADNGTATQRLTLPEGARVVLVPPFRPGAEAQQAPEKGKTIQADIRIEPASGGRPGRIVAVSIEVMGAKP